MDPAALAELIADENRFAVDAVLAAQENLATAMQWVAQSFQRGGRTIYVGAGTSARIAAADAAEMPPTFGVEAGRFVALVAGAATDRAIEGAEDDAEAAVADLRSLSPTSIDAVIGISASGRTPYVLAAIQEANQAGASTIGIANNPGSPLLPEAQLGILLDTGPEVLSGSTRLKAGTAQKIALNTISTGAMVLVGRVVGNAMSHMTPKNEKLRARATGIVMDALGVPEAEAVARLESAGWDLPKALGK
jgi:N-acetylmuramic acid 6-phosphate etherase